jgi:hypothetical protein
VTDGERWWAELTRRVERDPRYWWEAVKIDLACLLDHTRRLLRALARRGDG